MQNTIDYGRGLADRMKAEQIMYNIVMNKLEGIQKQNLEDIYSEKSMQTIKNTSPEEVERVYTKSDALVNWVFIKGLDGNWHAAKREYYYELFNGDKGNVLKAEHIQDLEALIIKGEGDIFKIQKLIK